MGQIKNIKLHIVTDIKSITMSKKPSTFPTNNSPASKTKKLDDGKKVDTTTNNNNNITNNETPNDNRQKYSFKNPNFQHSGAVRSGRKWTWKNLKPIALVERGQAEPDAAVYLNIET